MKNIHSQVRFVCLGQPLDFNVSLVVDSAARYYRFHFICNPADEQKLPTVARSFDIITNYKKEIVFNKLKGSRNELQQCLNDAAASYIKRFSYPGLVPTMDGEE